MTEETSRPRPVQQHHGADGVFTRLGIARRFEVMAAPGRRALQGRMRYIRNILIVLAVLTVAIVAYAQWLTWRPDPAPKATLEALNLAGYQTAFATAATAPQPTLPPATAIPEPTDTPKPTNTLVPVPTGRPGRKPTATIPASTPSSIPAPLLVAPAAGVTALERMVFEWAWDGPPLGDNQGFDLRIWSAQEEAQGGPRRGVAPVTKETSIEVSLAAVPAVLDYGPGDYFWTVILVEVNADGSPVVVGAWGESRSLVYP